MADIVYNQAKLEEVTNELEGQVKKLQEELEAFNQNYDVVKANWSGSEFETANVKLQEIKTTLETAIADNQQQITYLKQKNADFARATSGL